MEGVRQCSSDGSEGESNINKYGDIVENIFEDKEISAGIDLKDNPGKMVVSVGDDGGRGGEIVGREGKDITGMILEVKHAAMPHPHGPMPLPHQLMPQPCAAPDEVLDNTDEIQMESTDGEVALGTERKTDISRTETHVNEAETSPSEDKEEREMTKVESELIADEIGTRIDGTGEKSEVKCCNGVEGDGTSSNSVTLGDDGQMKLEETNSKPRYVLSDQLKLLTSSRNDFSGDNFFRGCKWAPDGSCILTCNNDNAMRIYNLPAELYSNADTVLSDGISPALLVPLRESVYDFCWYPRMSSWEPDTCCFITCCKDHPIHLWDAFQNKNRASYVPYNHLDEVTSPYSLAFSTDGERIFAGFRKCVRIFNLSQPGRKCTSISTYDKKTGGQSGIVSSIAMSPTMPRTYALGSYSCSVGLYSEDIRGSVMTLTGLYNGVTHMVFSQDGQSLYTGFRKNGLIVQWDLRKPGEILGMVEREVDTNQRIYFDTFSDGRYLISGSTSGYIYGWELGTGLQLNPEEDPPLPPLLRSRIETEAVNGVSAHPSLPILATCSGQRKYTLPGYHSDEECSGSDGESEDANSKGTNCLKLWSLSESMQT